MRISKKTRDEAILICAIAASNPDLSCNYDGVREALGLPLYDEAGAVWGKTPESAAWRECNHLDHNSQEVDAEAECLLRDGWSPGDPVEEL